MDKGKSGLMTLRSRIMLYTVIPVIIVIIAAGAFMTGSVRNIIDEMSRSEISGSTELVCAGIEEIISGYGEIAAGKAAEENVSRFLQTITERDSMEENAYFSYAMGELDSAISTYSGQIDRTWIASAVVQGAAFSNTSAGWTAMGDFDVTESFFYKDMLASGDYFITDPYVSSISNDIVVTVAAPVYDSRNNSILGVYCVDVKMTSLWNRIAALHDNGKDEIIICSGEGSVIYHSTGSYSGGSFGEVSVKNTGSDGTVESFLVNDKEMIGTFESPKNSRWGVYAIRSCSETEELMHKYTGMTLLVFAAVCVIMVIALVFGSQKIARPIQDYTLMINRLNISDGHGINADNEEILRPQGCSELENLAIGFNELIKRNNDMFSQLRKMNIKSEKERVLYQTALQSSSDVVFEYDIETDVMITYGSAMDSSVPKTQTTTVEGFLADIMTEDDYCASDRDYAQQFCKGDINGEMIISFSEGGKVIHWLSFEGTAVRSDDIPVKIVGTVRCIDDVVSLRQGAELDLFSGFYNKATMRTVVENRLSECSGTAAVIIVDIDYFKSINDVFGHAYGDFVIKDIADKIRSVIDDDTVAGRIGGDEFMLYVPSADKDSVHKLCTDLCNAIRYTYKDKDENNSAEVTVSASVGAALYPEHGSDFDEMYGSADIALYVSKADGKDRYTIFDGQKRPEYKGRVD